MRRLIAIENPVENGYNGAMKWEEEAMDRVRQEGLAEDIVKLTSVRLGRKLPWLAEAIRLPEHRWTDDETGTDGSMIDWNIEEVCHMFADMPARLERKMLHMALHLLYLHVYRRKQEPERFWWLACDILTEYRIDRMQVSGFERPIPVSRSRFYRKLKEEKVSLQEHVLAEWLEKQKLSDIKELEVTFRTDSHERWRQTEKTDQGEQRSGMEKMPDRSAEDLKSSLAAVHRWRTVFDSLEVRKSEHKRQKGGSAGDTVQTIVLQKERGYDYRQFLQQFAVTGEERCLDMDSFDYIPYDYSRRMYDRLVLLEPLEYKEVRRLSELVIAIDTSGSCSGEIVRRFLEETWNVLSTEGQFFRKMNLHVIQCDCVIQEHVRITCEEEWKQYLNQITVKGGGDTDFTPVFRLIEEMQQNGEFKDLRGLLYFTDGDGVYPSEPTPYETAFVFLNETMKKGKTPAWAHSLTLDLNEEHMV